MKDYDKYGFTPADSRKVCWGVTNTKDVALRIQYIGVQDSATVEVNAIGEILLRHGAVGAEAMDTSIGHLGLIATTAGAEDTVGEVLNIINASGNWRVIHVDAILEDSLNGTLLLMAESSAKVKGGLALLWDTVLCVRRLVATDQIRDNIEVYYDGEGNIDYDLPFRGTRSSLKYMAGVATYGSPYSDFYVHSETPRMTAAGAALQSTQIYYDIAGATDVDTIATGLNGREEFALVGNLGQRVVARLCCRGGITAASFRGVGRMFRSLD